VSARLAVRLQPGARRAGVRGRLADGTLRLAVTEPPEAGRANRALIELVCELLGIEPPQVRLARGGSSRSKTLAIEGIAPAELERRVARLVAEATDAG
jgi:uncharacterized protein YggU (UPF0235/DUF167 family)